MISLLSEVLDLFQVPYSDKKTYLNSKFSAVFTNKYWQRQILRFFTPQPSIYDLRLACAIYLWAHQGYLKVSNTESDSLRQITSIIGKLKGNNNADGLDAPMQGSKLDRISLVQAVNSFQNQFLKARSLHDGHPWTSIIPFSKTGSGNVRDVSYNKVPNKKSQITNDGSNNDDAKIIVQAPSSPNEDQLLMIKPLLSSKFFGDDDVVKLIK